MKQRLDNAKRSSIYDYDQRIERTLNLVSKECSKRNQEIINNYHKSMISDGIAKATRHKHLQTLLNLTRFLGKDWDNATKSDIENIIVKIINLYSDDVGKETHSTHDHKKILKIFFRWLKLGSRNRNDVGDPLETKDVKVRRVADKIVREDLITDDDLSRLLYACGENARDRAFIDCQYESGTRPGEILSLKIKHVKFDKNGAVLHVDGKTGARPVRIIRSTPNLANWMNVHPLQNDPDAPLWIDLGNKNYGSQLTYAAASAMVKRRCKKAHLSKRIYLNLFRHSEATSTANYMTEAQMRKRHGWTSYSKMPGRYVHLVNSDVEDAIFRHYGIKQDSKEKKHDLPIQCSICEMQNSPDSKMCSKCGKPLNLETALDLEEKDKQRQEMLEDRIARQEQATKTMLDKFNELVNSQRQISGNSK